MPHRSVMFVPNNRTAPSRRIADAPNRDGGKAVDLLPSKPIHFRSPPEKLPVEGPAGDMSETLANHYVEIRTHVSGVYLHLGVYMLSFIG